MDWFLYDIGLRHERVKHASFNSLLVCSYFFWIFLTSLKLQSLIYNQEWYVYLVFTIAHYSIIMFSIHIKLRYHLVPSMASAGICNRKKTRHY